MHRQLAGESGLAAEPPRLGYEAGVGTSMTNSLRSAG
jgi:hypothetical protein